MSPTPLILAYTLNDVSIAAQQLWHWANGVQILTFSGSLGAGKTTFIHALCDTLGVEDAVSSPTFALINEYRFADNGGEHIIYHMDWYRLRSTDEAVDAGMEDALRHPTAICLVEWPEKAPELLTGIAHVRISIQHTGEWERELKAEYVGTVDRWNV